MRCTSILHLLVASLAAVPYAAWAGRDDGADTAIARGQQLANALK